MKENITFSVEVGNLTEKDVDESSSLAEIFFNMESKPDEIPASKENREFVLKNMPECDNVIKAGSKVIGFTFIVPCNNKIMAAFLSSKITENNLFEEVKRNVNYLNFNTIYLCSFFIKKEYRGMGLATKGNVMSVRKIIGKRKIKPILFSWPHTEGGQRTAEKVSRELGFELKLKPYPQ